MNQGRAISTVNSTKPSPVAVNASRSVRSESGIRGRGRVGEGDRRVAVRPRRHSQGPGHRQQHRRQQQHRGVETHRSGGDRGSPEHDRQQSISSGPSAFGRDRPGQPLKDPEGRAGVGQQPVGPPRRRRPPGRTSPRRPSPANQHPRRSTVMERTSRPGGRDRGNSRLCGLPVVEESPDSTEQGGCQQQPEVTRGTVPQKTDRRRKPVRVKRCGKSAPASRVTVTAR